MKKPKTKEITNTPTHGHKKKGKKKHRDLPGLALSCFTIHKVGQVMPNWQLHENARGLAKWIQVFFNVPTTKSFHISSICLFIIIFLHKYKKQNSLLLKFNLFLSEANKICSAAWAGKMRMKILKLHFMTYGLGSSYCYTYSRKWNEYFGFCFYYLKGYSTSNFVQVFVSKLTE